jgi:hypothetical protein
MKYDRATNTWVDKFGNRFVHQGTFRQLWARGRLLKGQGQRPTVPDFIAVARKYARDNPAGGALHVIVADENLKTVHVQGCYDRAIEINDGYGAALALLLLHMTKSQRGRVAKLWSYL